MKINQIDLGSPSHPHSAPITGQNVSSIVVEGGDTVVWARGGIERKQTVGFTIKAWYPIGGQPAGSVGAAKYLILQLEELTNNVNMQPCFIQFNATDDPAAIFNATELHDGWYIVDDFEPDYEQNIVTALVRCRMTVTAVGMGWKPRGTSIAYAGGALASAYVGGGIKNLVAGPTRAAFFDAGTFFRPSGEGQVPVSLSPVAQPEPIALGNNVADLFRGEVTAYDTLSTAQNPVPLIGTVQTLFRSLGTDSLGTLAAWATGAGAPSIATNVVTLPVGARINAGHQDWTDLLIQQRFLWSTGLIPQVNVRFIDVNNHVDATIQGASLRLDKYVGGVQTTGTGGAVGVIALVTGTQYWLQARIIGTTYTLKIFADNAGAINLASQVGATAMGTITDDILQSGGIGLWAIAGTCTFGGAFANVCQVVGPSPPGWTPACSNWTLFEPAFCWSQNAPAIGGYSVSTFARSAATGGANASWAASIIPGAGTYLISAQMKGVGAPNAYYQLDSSAISASVVADGAWHFIATTIVSGGANAFRFMYTTGTGTAYYDAAMVQLSGAALPLISDGFEAFVHPNWLEVFHPDHDFTGDCVITNGLLMFVFTVGGTVASWYLWNPAQAVPSWQSLGTVTSIDVGTFLTILRYYNLTRVGPDEIAISLLGATTNGAIIQFTLRLNRGHYSARIDLKPLTAANNQYAALALSLPVVQKILYNPSKAADVSLTDAAPLPTTDFGYGAAFVASAAQAYIAGFLYQIPPGLAQPMLFGASNFVGAGDTAGPALAGTRSYGVFATPFGVPGISSPANLQAEAESGTLSQATGPVIATVADGAGASPGSGNNAVSFPVGTYSAGFAIVTTALWVPPPGTYIIAVRVRTTTNGAGAVSEVTFDSGGTPTTLGGTAIAPNAATTAYKWYLSAAITLDGIRTVSPRLYTSANPITTTVVWIVDEFVLLPITLGVDKRGPQELWQQWMFDRSTKLVT